MINPATHIAMCEAEFAAGRASRDAEITGLREQNAALQRSIDFDQLQAQQETISQLRDQVTLLEAEVARLNKGWYEANGVILEKALATTEPRSTE